MSLVVTTSYHNNVSANQDFVVPDDNQIKIIPIFPKKQIISLELKSGKSTLKASNKGDRSFVSLQIPDEDDLWEKSLSKFKELNVEKSPMHGRWVVIYRGKLREILETKQDGMKYSLAHIPLGKRAVLSQIGQKIKTKQYRIR